MAQDEQRCIREGLAELKRFGKRCNGKVACAVCKQRGRNADCAKTIAVCLDDRHDSAFRADHRFDRFHIAGDRSKVYLNKGVAQK